MSRIGFSGAIDRLPAVQTVLSGLQSLSSDADPKRVEALRSQVRDSMNAVVRELGKEDGPDVPSVDTSLADARAGVEDLGHEMGYIDESGAIIESGPAAEAFHEVSDYLADIEVAWRNQRPTLLELQNALPYRSWRYGAMSAGAAALVVLILWLLLRNSTPQPIAASDAPVFPSPAITSEGNPTLVPVPPFDTSLRVSSRPNTTPPLNLSLPNETRTRTPGTDFPSIDLNSMLPTSTPTAQATGPLVVDPQQVTERCNKDNTFLSPTAYKIINNTGQPVLYSATVSGNWAVAGPPAGTVANGQTTAIGVVPTADSNGHIVACQTLISQGRNKGDFYLTITVNNFQYLITVTVYLFNG
jgi:hypothetical protein